MILSVALLLSGRLDTRPAQQLQAEEAAASPPRQSEVRSSHSPGETTLRVLEAGGFRVGAVVRIHEGHPNQEDHRVRYITPSTLRLEGAGLELHHNRGERVVQLAVDEDCPRNCSGRAACVDGACNCPAAYAGDDCSIEVSACPGDCSGHGAAHGRATATRVRRRLVPVRGAALLLELLRPRDLLAVGPLRLRARLRRRGLLDSGARLPVELHGPRRF